MRKLAGLVAIGCLAVAAPAWATNGMRMIGFGAVQDSMGGVGAGLTLDSSAIVSNPAGLTDLGWRLDVAGGYFKPTVKYNATGFVASQDASLDSNRGGSPIPTVGYVHPINEQLTTGVGVFAVSGMGVDYETNLYGGPTLTSYMNVRLAPAVAYKIMEGLSVGLTANVMMAQMKYDVASGAGQVPHDTATAFGFGATLGVKYSPTKEVSIGAAYETKSFFQDFKFDIPSHPIPGGGGTFPAGTDSLAFDQPQSATLGASFAPFEELVLGADVQWINWSDTNGKNLPKYTNDTSTTGAFPFNMNWSDQWVLKVGAQVTPMKQLRIRAGYNYGKMPLDPNRAFENIAFPAVSEHHITAGVGYDFSKSFTMNVAGVYALSAKISGANGAAPPAGQGIPSYTTEMSQYEIELGIAYRF